MADFQSQTMGITGLTIDASSTAPSRSEFSTFLNDGVIDVTYRWLAVKPQDRESFVRESSTTASNGLDIGGATIISVLREAGIDGDTDGSTAWRSCRKIPASMQSRVVDTESLHFGSKYNPVYTIDDNGVVNVYPTPDGTDDGFRVYYVNNSPAETDGTALDHASTGIKYFPNDKVYLVILYASIKSLQSSLSAINISSFSLSASAPTTIPSAPTIAGGSVSPITIDALPSAPNYTGPTVGGDATELSALEDLDTDNTIDVHADQIEWDQWFATVGHLIEDEEDTELAQAQLQKITAYIQTYSAAMQNQLNIFNEGNAVYQAAIQRNLAQAQINMQDAQKEADLTLQGAIADYQNELQRVSIDAQKYQALVAAEVQTYQQEIAEKGNEYQWMSARLQDLKQEYDTAFAIAAPRPAQ